MKCFISLKSTLLFLVLSCFYLGAQAQLPADMSKIKAAQITDAQLSQFVQQAGASGMGESELMAEFQKRGLPESEIQALAARVKSLGVDSDAKGTSSTASSEGKRVFKGESTVYKAPEKTSRVFGTELFSGAEPLFVPNLRIATPKNYELGPEDELQLEIYGNNVSSQKLVVSPDGFVNVKYAGPVNVNGLSIEKAAEVFRTKLLKFYPALSSGATKLQLTLGSVRSIQVSVIGAVKKPGTVTLPSITTLFNALYASGGPLDNGSFRNIELIRNNKVLTRADLYDFLLKGDQSSNVGLRDNDVIRVPFATTQVMLDGGLNRTGIFEVKAEESLEQAFAFAGGFKSNAFKGRVTGTRFTDVDKKIIDVSLSDFSNYKLQNGDSLFVNEVVNRFENRVQITGAVFKPGSYSLEKGMDLKTLLNKAQGIKEDAFTGRVNIVRLREDMSKEYKTINLRSVLNGTEQVELRKEDSLHVVSILELKDIRKVTIQGPVKNPGEYPFEDSLTLESLILQAGGLLENATPSNIEIGRRKKNINLGEKGSPTSELILIDMQKDLSKLGKDVLLEPFDEVSIKLDPSKINQVTVKISGEVLYAGTYTLQNPEERISSVLKRAGGILPYGDMEGARLLRSEKNTDTSNIKRLLASELKAEQRDSLLQSQTGNNAQSEVSLNLRKAMERPGSTDDIILKNGDELVVPKFNSTVKVDGQVLKPVTVQFEEGKGLGGYISDAGGFSRKALKGRSFVVYANGSAAKTRNFLGLKSYPRIKPGSSIFIPEKPEGKGIDPAKAGVFVSAFSAVMTAVILFFRY